MEEKLNNAMNLFARYRSTGKADLLYRASSEVDAYLNFDPDNQKAIDLKRDIEAALHHVR